jgi:undecaprenyl-diphosphatase
MQEAGRQGQERQAPQGREELVRPALRPEAGGPEEEVGVALLASVGAGNLLLVVLVVVAVLALAAASIGRGREIDIAPLRTGQLAALLALLVTVFVALLVGVTVDGGSQLVSIDGHAARFLAEHREPWLTSALKVLTWAGSTMLLAPLVIATGLVLRRATASWRPLVFLATCLAGAGVLANLIKLAVGRARPDDPLAHAIGYAFPSGHATNSAAGWLALAIALGALTATRGRRLALFGGALLVAGIVGLSRVYLRVHAATDVLAGWALGAAWVIVVLVATAALDRRRA